MSVLDKLRSGELQLWHNKYGKYYKASEEDKAEVIKTLELGERMRWVDGKPPAFGENERKWIVFEYLTPFLKTRSYVTAVWLDTSYSEVKVKLARKWMPLPEPPKEEK